MIVPPWAGLLAPLEEFTRLHAATLRRFGHRAIDLSFPNPRFLSDPRPYRTLADLAARSGPVDLRYSPFGGFTPVRRRIAAALSRQHQLPYQRGDIIMTPGASAALAVVFGALFPHSDRIVVPTPCWMDYPLYLAHAGIGCDLAPGTIDKRLDLAAIEAAWTPRTRGLVISQPVSPTGVVHNNHELAQLAALLHRVGAQHGNLPLLIADEAHCQQAWARSPCPAPASHYANTVTVRSVTKGWDMQGQRTGYLAVSPHFRSQAPVSQLLEHYMRASGHCAPTALMQHLAAALSDTHPDVTGLGELQRHARCALAQRGVEVVDAAATRFLYARCPIPDDRTFVARLADRGVLTMPSSIFHEPGWFRLALNIAQPELDRAIDIIAEEATDV
ncbi:aminotransferase class I/II-fold pyridoxal phosphate-dependent enzyme [Cryptosporangium sp. NPDC048952]|uniref:aminotransferase class I/II-fold pyridoxal phosphate-dependent enzyme n=1 Tax=Cryptosporangium sp. NPDC048952 TaxID=3363961 RepID=UPI00371AF30E